MSQTAKLDYFYGKQAGESSFYQIPKELFTDPRFKNMSFEAKFLYSYLVDQMSQSAKNNWIDEEGRAFIVISINEICNAIGCCRQTVVNRMAELDARKGAGLIEKKRRGQGKANIVYVKCLVSRKEDTRGKKTTGSPQVSKNHTSGSLNNRRQEVQKADGNYIDINNTTGSNETRVNKNILSDLSIGDERKRYDADGSVNYYAYLDLIKENIGYDVLCRTHPVEEVDGIAALMADTVCTSRHKIVVGSESMPAAVVRSRLLKLDYSHIEYVFECMNKTTTKIRNIKQYLLASLYNAPATIGHYYTAEANHDLYGSDQGDGEGVWNDG